MCNMLLQTIGKSFKESILAMARQGLFFISAILILPRLLGLFGVEISQMVGDILAFLLALPMGLSVIKELNELRDRC